MKKLLSVLLIFTLAFSIPHTAFATSRHEVLMIGDENEYVTELQKALIEQDYLDHKATGYFGTNTQKAVLQFQKDNGLTVDGKAGPKTRKALLGSQYTEIPDPNNKAENENNTDNSVDMEMLFSGSEGPAVEKLQTRLKELGYYTYSKITGYFGPITKDAVKRFQRDNDLTVDGIAGSKTLAKLYEEQVERSYLVKGDKHSDVTVLQDRLKELGYFSGKSTGYFGSKTDAAVRAFQTANSLKADGKVGTKTWAKLNSPDAIGADGSSSSNNNSDSNNNSNSSSESLSGVDKFIAVLMEQEGKPYVYSTEGPNSFDCSGLVYYSLRNAGISVSRRSAASYSAYDAWTEITNMNGLKKGDLMFFNSSSSKSVNHTGVYLGSGMMIHASSSNKKVIVASCTTNYWKTHFVNARRVY